MKSLEFANISPNTKVIVRADLDVPFVDGSIEDTFRLDHLLPTLRFLEEKHAHIIIMGHIGRPNGIVVDSLSTAQLTPYFNKALHTGTFELLENLRFNFGEEKNDAAFAQELASKADVYVNECFSTSHRAHASFVGVPKLLPSFAGFRLMEEVNTLKNILDNPTRPLVAVVGGAKVETKGPAVTKFLEICDCVLVGGKLAHAFSTVSSDHLLVAHDFSNNGFDIGPKAIATFVDIIKTAKSVIWAGPLGLCEEGYLEGTQSVAAAIIESCAFSVVGGGDTIAALKGLGLLSKFSFVSTGGGAMLEFLIKGNLPGLEALGYRG